MKENANKPDPLLRIGSEEIKALRLAVLNKYVKLTGEEIENPDKRFNSNLDNYESLRSNIEDSISPNSMEAKSAKPLAVLFHFSKTDKKIYHAFRGKFINALYYYVYRLNRDDYMASLKTPDDSSIGVRQLKNIEGYWESYYDKDNDFKETLINQKEASLGIVAIIIKGEGINNAVVEYLTKSDTGNGTVEVQGANLVFNLRSSNTSEPTYIFMNCGRDIEDTIGHLKNSAGLFLHINENGSPKAGKCLMQYFDEEAYCEKYNTRSIDFDNEMFKKYFTGQLNISPKENINNQQRKIRQFFQKGKNTMDSHISHFRTVEENS